jgi:two-component system response regulator YesN
MYQLLIVDDEYNIRDGIANAIPWNTIHVNVADTAVNGIDALRKMEQLHIDIVITDVYMDKMDGLTLAEMIRQLYPHIKILILSGYEEFEYVRRALQLKVESYLVKPTDPKALLTAVKEAVNEIEEEAILKNRIYTVEMELTRNRDMFIERFFYDLVHAKMLNNEEYNSRAQFLELNCVRSYYCCCVVSILETEALFHHYGAKKLQSLVLSIREISCSKLDGFDIWPLIGEIGSLILVTGCDDGGADHFLARVTEHLERIAERIQRYLSVSVSAAAGSVCKNALEVPKSYREASIALERSIMNGINGIVSISDFMQSGDGFYDYPVEKEALLIRNLFDADSDRMRKLLGDLFDALPFGADPQDGITTGVMSLVSAISKRALDMGVDFYSLFNDDLQTPSTALVLLHSREQIEEWTYRMIARTVDEIKKHQMLYAHNIIKKANDYMNRNIANPSLSLTAISEHLHLSPSYFSRLYKKETGETYVDALTKARIIKAKYLLADTNEKITTISDQVGYLDAKYFRLIFKKYCGISPSEFRNRQHV